MLGLGFGFTSPAVLWGAGGGAAVGGAALLVGEANGFAADFTYATDANRVAVKETLGAELVTNGGFDSGTGWTLGAGWTISGGQLVGTAVAAFVAASQTLVLTASRAYRVTFTVTVAAGGLNVYLGSNGDSVAELTPAPSTSVQGALSYSKTFVSGTQQICFRAGGSGFTGTIDIVSIKEVVSVGTTTTTEYAVDSFFANAGTSPKQVYNAAGTLVWSPHNMCVQSDTPGTTWTLLNITVNGNKLEETAVSGVHRQNQSITVVQGAIYTWSRKVKPEERTSVTLTTVTAAVSTVVYDLTGAGSISSATGVDHLASSITLQADGFYLCTNTFVASSGTGLIIYTSLQGGTSYLGVLGSGLRVAAAQFNRGSTPTAYLPTTTAARYGLALDYDPVTHAAKGLLCEPAGTNLLTLSQDISGLTAEGGTATLNDQVGPDGLSTADTFTENTATSNHDCYGSSVVTANVDHTLSRYFKMGTRRYATMGWSDGTNAAYAVYDLQSGVVGSSATVGTGVLNSASIQACSNGWYRCILSGKVNAATMYRTFGAATAATITPDAYGRQSFLGTGATLFMAHAQLETGTVATSPIPTYAASATRAADNYSFLLSAIPALGAEYSVYGRFSMPVTTNVRHVYALNDGTTSERVGWRITGGNAGLGVIDGGVSVAFVGSSAVVANTPMTGAGRIKLNDVNAAMNGVLGTADTAVTLPTVDQVRFGSDSAASLEVYRIEKMSIVPRAWTDLELQAKTT